MKQLRWQGALIGLLLVVAACGPSDGGATTTDSVTVDQGTDLTFHMITHSDDGVFWSVVKRGAEDAGKALGVTVVWNPSVNTPEKQVTDIEAAIAADSDGMGVSLAAPEAVGPAVVKAVAAGIPVITVNSGSNQYKELGAITHVGQTEIVAGEGAGERFNALGAKHVLCARQEQTNIGLEERCTGLENTFGGDVTSEFIGLDTDPTAQEAQIAALLQADSTIDAVLGTGPNVAVRAVAAGTTAGRTLIIGGFDISDDIVGQIEAKAIAFTVDQQQYVQGYLPIVLLYLNNVNLNTVGGGLPVLTGPGFVDTENVSAVKALVQAGTR